MVNAEKPRKRGAFLLSLSQSAMTLYDGWLSQVRITVIAMSILWM